MPYYTEKQIEQARSIDLLTYLQTYEPTELVHVRGNTYCTREHDSLKISNGKWMWWSRGFGGNSALDYLIKVKGMSFMDAMKILTKEGTDLHDTDAKISRKPDCDVKRKLLLPERNENEMAVIWYLVGRGIDYDIIKECIDNGLIFESEVYHNCVFLGFDENGKAAYEIVEHIGTIDVIDGREEKWTKEVNVVAWNGGKPKIDVRDWNEAHDRMSRGITLTEDQAMKMAKALMDRYRTKAQEHSTSMRDDYVR